MRRPVDLATSHSSTDAYAAALELTAQEAQRRYLERRMAEVNAG